MESFKGRTSGKAECKWIRSILTTCIHFVWPAHRGVPNAWNMSGT